MQIAEEGIRELEKCLISSSVLLSSCGYFDSNSQPEVAPS